jgi:hypothetical protein
LYGAYAKLLAFQNRINLRLVADSKTTSIVSGVERSGEKCLFGEL